MLRHRQLLGIWLLPAPTWLLTVLLILPSLSHALNWPLEGAPIAASFGQNLDGRPNLSMTFSGSGIVRAIAAGEVLFAWNEDWSWNDFPSSLGNWLAVDHRDSLIGIYAGLHEAFAEDRSLLEKGSILGTTSAQPPTEAFRFTVYDAKESRWINPVMLFAPRSDRRPPVIQEVRLKDSMGTVHNLTSGKTLAQGLYTVIVVASDSEDSLQPSSFAPLRIDCIVNGSVVAAVNFEFFYAPSGGLLLSATVPMAASPIYSDAGFTLGAIRLNRGRSNLELSAYDASGNSRTVSYSLVLE